MVPNTRLDGSTEDPTREEAEEMSKVPYRQLVGSLQHLARVSRPDIQFSVNQLARHCAKPRKDAWDAGKCLLRYLAGTINMKLKLSVSGDGTDIVTDADFANDRQDRKSVSGYVV
jgi:hypothetical protein